MKFAVVFGLIFYLFCNSDAIAQPTMDAIVFQKEPAAEFSFLNNWAYAWDVVKHDNGKFEKVDADRVTATDTVHLYYTANCKTNVQGGYAIRYCNASKANGKISLVFADGMPAYSSEFDITIVGNNYCFKPEVVYPELSMRGKLVYKTTYSKLILFQKDPAASKIISGYIDVRFVESSSVQGDLKKQHYYLRGYFKTPVNSD